MDFNSFLSQFTEFQDLTSSFSMLDVTIAITLSFVLNAFIGWIYMITHRGTSYTQSYVHTLVMMGMIVAIIMLIVGSNIARAFSLVGALSIIRFRNAVKETRDVGFIFFAMAIGMAMGTKFYLLGIMATAIISLVILIMNRFDWYARRVKSQILKIQLDNATDFEHLFDDVLVKYTESSHLMSVDSVRGGALTELVYSVTTSPDMNKQEFIYAIRTLTSGQKVSLITGYNATDL